jgi:hypothetical protein
MFHLIVCDKSEGHETSNLYCEFTLFLVCSKSGRVYAVWWLCIVDSHPLNMNTPGVKSPVEM